MQNNPTVEFLKSQGFSEHFLERFWRNVFIQTEGRGCWLWLGGLSHGYGFTHKNGKGSKKIRAHVASWILHHGTTNGLCVLHKCDNPPCCNPHHLFLGTKADNMADCISKGRMRRGINKGTQHGRSKLTENDVQNIRALYKRGEGERMALEFGVSSTVIYKIVKRQLWTHIG